MLYWIVKETGCTSFPQAGRPAMTLEGSNSWQLSSVETPAHPHAPPAELVVEAYFPHVSFPGKRSSEGSTSLDAHRTVGGAPPCQLKNTEGKPSELKERQSDGENTHLYCLLDMGPPSSQEIAHRSDGRKPRQSRLPGDPHTKSGHVWC